mgnify:CR=1 FL=1
MIKNIVFDMGKVLVDYKEDPVCRRFCADEALILSLIHISEPTRH